MLSNGLNSHGPHNITVLRESTTPKRNSPLCSMAFDYYMYNVFNSYWRMHLIFGMGLQEASAIAPQESPRSIREERRRHERSKHERHMAINRLPNAQIWYATPIVGSRYMTPNRLTNAQMWYATPIVGSRHMTINRLTNAQM